ncbi:hypothetical protein NM208_g12161 [Fusarium decemcellulare]|uniref:Uncharacterized protein n=1 Tax=Fusarium decemcellulare TaxID=57161 RepID=A0ACC1RT89_9HYPO|nr:hypothetical protein NM208_g12161 [Fusarium decemcellulare]
MGTVNGTIGNTRSNLESDLKHNDAVAADGKQQTFVGMATRIAGYLTPIILALACSVSMKMQSAWKDRTLSAATILVLSTKLLAPSCVRAVRGALLRATRAHLGLAWVQVAPGLGRARAGGASRDSGPDVSFVDSGQGGWRRNVRIEDEDAGMSTEEEQEMKRTRTWRWNRIILQT